jgi:triacylglycerol lipase
MSDSTLQPPAAHDPHHVFLIPGLFGFARLAGYDYFVHLERALHERLEAAGAPHVIHVVATPPTASITVRAAVVAAEIARSANGSGPIHLVGHSTGGLDARLLLTPGVSLPLPPAELEWRRRARSVVAINAPHYGTPLAAHFTTVAGTHLLYALSLLTVTTLSIGRLPLTVLSSLLAVIGGATHRLRIRLLDELTHQVLRFVDEQGRDEISEYLRYARADRGGIVQLMPEVMELFNMVVGDNPGVRYGCVVSAGPPPHPGRVPLALISPIAALQLGVYTTVYGIASRDASRYPYATPSPEQKAQLERRIGPVTPGWVDGIVPTLSMLWGELLWCGKADHLDIVGHFADDREPAVHVDWLSSGAHFRRGDFEQMTDAVCRFVLRG